MPEGCRFRPRCPYAAEKCLPTRRCARCAPGSRRPVTSPPGPSGRPSRPRTPSERRAMSQVLMEVSDLAVHFKARPRRGARARRRLARVAAGRDPRRGGRVGLRKVHAGARDARHWSSRRPARCRWTGKPISGRGSAARASPAGPDDLPGPLPDAESAPAGEDDRRRAARRPGGAEGRARRPRPARAWRTSAWTAERFLDRGIRTSSRAASASAWRSPRRSCSSPRG